VERQEKAFFLAGCHLVLGESNNETAMGTHDMNQGGADRTSWRVAFLQEELVALFLPVGKTHEGK